jgi:hypothetical protein
MIPNANFEIDNDMMAISTIKLNSNHKKIKQFHASLAITLCERI